MLSEVRKVPENGYLSLQKLRGKYILIKVVDKLENIKETNEDKLEVKT